MNSKEFNFANRAFLSHHPAAANWIKAHSFYLCQLDILQIVVLDWYGGPHHVKTEDYYNVNSTSNGFLNYGNSIKQIQLVNDYRSSNSTSDNEGQVKIKIKKGGDVVTIEL